MQNKISLSMRVLKPVVAVLSSLWLALLLGPTGFAIAGPAGFWTVSPALAYLDCTPGNPAYVHEVYLEPPLTFSEYGYTVTNMRTGSYSSYYSSYGPSAGGSVVDQLNWYTTIPVGTQPGDVLLHSFYWINDGVYAVTNSPIGWVCDTGEIVFPDDRINHEAIAGPVALYCTDNGLEVWDIDADGVGTLAFTYNGSFDIPAANTLLMSAGDIQLWILDSGEFQVNADAGEGKTYAFVFNGCPYDGNGYNANIDPNE